MFTIRNTVAQNMHFSLTWIKWKIKGRHLFIDYQNYGLGISSSTVKYKLDID
jgi:hypothetical protein